MKEYIAIVERILDRPLQLLEIESALYYKREKELLHLYKREGELFAFYAYTSILTKIKNLLSVGDKIRDEILNDEVKKIFWIHKGIEELQKAQEGIKKLLTKSIWQSFNDEME